MEGEYVTVIGPNGGGKSTLAKLLLGLLAPTRGSVSLYGGDPIKMRRRVGYVPQYQRFDPLFPITTIDVVAMGLLNSVSVWRRALRREKALDALGKVGLADRAFDLFSDLSYGQRQLVYIARALVFDPDMLILDEPTASLDRSREERLGSILDSFRPSVTIILITHDLVFALANTDRVLCVNGTVDTHPTQLLTPELLTSLYGGRKRLVRHDLHSD